MNMNQTGVCHTKTCDNRGKRARGARDIEGFAQRTGVFDKSFYCDECRAAAAQRSLMPYSNVQKIKRVQIVEA